MKAKKKDQSGPITGPLLESLLERDKANFAANLPSPSIGEKQLPPPDLYQDPGSGYNANFVFPQE